jgi:predicted ATPase
MNNPAQIKCFIFTGTPGSGKTSVIVELEKLGHSVIHEAATDVISQEQAKGCDAPWEEPEFVDKITHMEKERQMDATGDL